MEYIKTVKISGDGYLVNGHTNVPKVDGNRHYQEVKQWIAKGNTPDPEFTPEELQAMEDAQAKYDAKNQGEIYTLNGIDYKVSFTTRDAMGLLQIKAFFELGKEKIAKMKTEAEYLNAPTDEARALLLDPIKKAFEKTNISLQSGALVPVKEHEFFDFSLWWALKRNSFFADRV